MHALSGYSARRAYALDKVLIELGLLRAPNIRRVHVPTILLKQ